MDQIFTCVLLLMRFFGMFTKYIHVNDKMNWLEAQTYCRQNYIDLAPVSNDNDANKLQQLSSNVSHHIWIGLVRNCSHREQWLWSGGGAVSRFSWKPGEPNDFKGIEDYGCVRNKMWNDEKLKYEATFFCYGAVVVKEGKTWEEALEYCREHHDDLASVSSETEMLLLQKELSKHNTTEHVWIGLRFLPGNWLWVDGQEMDYEAWGQGGKPSCPHAKIKCGALKVTGGSKAVWEAHDCEERLHFICY
ncbi:unnamed protein product [Oreochromis niloticus]|nr:unnamed protein product [Mustela putorius furo]